jgi:hypothetical protein
MTRAVFAEIPKDGGGDNGFLPILVPGLVRETVKKEINRF